MAYQYIIYIDTDLYLVQILFICRPADFPLILLIILQVCLCADLPTILNIHTYGPTLILNIHIIYIGRRIGGSAGQQIIRVKIKYIQYVQDERWVAGSAGRQINRGVTKYRLTAMHNQDDRSVGRSADNQDMFCMSVYREVSPILYLNQKKSCPLEPEVRFP